MIPGMNAAITSHIPSMKLTHSGGRKEDPGVKKRSMLNLSYLEPSQGRKVILNGRS